MFGKIGGITRLSCTRLYEGSEDDSFHACCMPGDGSLIRLRVDPGMNKLYRQRVTSPDENSNYSQWTDWEVTAHAVAICACGATVYAFRMGTDGHLYRCESSDNGANWGSWTDMGDIGSSPAHYGLAACFKDADEAIVLYSREDTRQEYYIEGDDTDAWVHENNWYAQTFTPSQAHSIAWVKLKLSRTGSPGTSTVSIKATDGSGHPTGADLTSGTIDGNNLTTDSEGAWYIISLTPYVLSASTKYAIVVRAPSGNIGNRLNWRFDGSSPTYAGGNFEHSDDAGSSWTAYTGRDFMFEEWEGQGQRSGDIVYRRRLSGGSWEDPDTWPNDLDTITGLAVNHEGDWNVIITGTQASSAKPIVCTCVLGDGYSAAVGNWSSLKELTIAESDSDIAFKFPTLDMPDVFRAFLVEAYSGNESYNRPYWTHSLATADFIDNLWREPVPFNLSSDYGLAMCHKSPHIWLTRPDGVWRASISAGSVEITDSVLQIKAETNETSGRITIVLRNDDGRFAPIHRGQSGDTYEAIKLGSEIKFSPGYHTTAESSPEHSTGLAHWITGWEYPSHAGRAEFILHAVDGWGLLEEWKARRQFSWASGDKNIFQLLNFIFARAGLEFSSFSSSSAITAQYPTFTIYPSENGRAAVLRLLAMVEDVLFFRGHYGYLKHPQTSDSTDYTYGTDHAIHEGIYRQYVKQVNRAQAFGDSVFTEDWDWDEVELVLDKLAQAYDINLDTTTKAHQRGDAMLREAAIRAVSGYIMVPLNCGQELYDVVEITDSRAGLSSVKRRILGLNHHYVPAKGIYSLTAILGTV